MIMPTPTVTPSSCQETRRRRSSSSSSSSSATTKRDEHLPKMADEKGEAVTTNLEQTDPSGFNLKRGEMQTFRKKDDQREDQSKTTTSSPTYVPVYQQNLERAGSSFEKSKAGGINPRPGGGGGIVYAELQLPRSSNNGSMRRGGNRRHPQQKTQYAEITFQGRPLQTAEI